MQLHRAGYKSYWAIWGVLLALTLAMLVLDEGKLPGKIVLSGLLIAMAVKASAIGAYFMHLRFEQPRVAFLVVLGLGVTGALLFGVIAFDAKHILEVSPH